MGLLDARAGASQARRLVQLVNEYRWLLDSYVIEFFTENHWSRLPKSWQESLHEADLVELSHLLLGNNTEENKVLSKVYPLSFLAFCAATHSLSLPRQPPSGPTHPRERVQSQLDGLEHVFRCHIKPKKQHEIKVFGEVIHQLCIKTNCKNVIDIGSGQGHLARYLAHKYGLSVTCIEGVGSHLTTAAKYDRDVERLLAKKVCQTGSALNEDSVADDGSLTHVEAMIQPEASIEDILSLLNDDQTDVCSYASTAPESNDQYQLSIPGVCSRHNIIPPTSKSHDQCQGEIPEACHNITPSQSRSHDAHYIMVGLHTCGDLAPTILRVFARSRRVVGVASVGCCYMKLTCEEENGVWGYPMSQSGQSWGCSLSYEAREVACHSIEMYKERLQGGPGSFEHLKVHAHRAAVEVLFRKRGLRRTQVRISKRVSKLPFKEYACALLQSVGPTQATPTQEAEEGELDELSRLVDAEWKRVVMFFMLRLALAPCVESIVLLDWALFLVEQGYTDVTLTPLFDPLLSPRNHIVMAT